MAFNLPNPSNQTQLTNPATGNSTAFFFSWLNLLWQLLKATLGRGYTGTVTLGKLTPGGTEGSMTLVNGVTVSVTEAT